MLNAEAVAARRIPIEQAELTHSKDAHWHCDYCDKRFVSETIFMKHHCEEKRRAGELASPLGQAAYAFFRHWFQVRRFSPQSSSTFLASKYYRRFINFAEFVQKTNIGKPDRYIELMVEFGLGPELWLSSGAYTFYLEWLDKVCDPIDQVADSAAFLADLADREEVPHDQIIEHLGPQRVLGYLHQHRISPWLLLRSSGFKRLFHSFDNEQKKALKEIVDFDAWAGRFKSNPELVNTITELVEATTL